jgi:ABC-type transport system substrate-binding protein
MVGNGPFVLEAARSADRIVLARNPEWDGTRYDPGLRLPEQPYLERITFRASPDPDAAFDAFVAGDADVAGVSAAQQREARDRFSNTFDVPIFSTFHLQVGWHDPVVGGPDNVLLRRAILQAINRAEVNDEEFLGTATVADGITSPGIPGYEEGACDRCTHDPDAARADLADWTAEGNELDEPLRIQTGVAPGASDPAAAVIVADLAAVGIEAVEEPLGREFLPRLTEGACQLCLVATFPPYLSYDAVLSDGFHSDADPTRNLGAFTDGTFDRLIDDARATSSPTERADAFHAAEQRLLSEEVAAIPLVWFAHPYVYAADVAEFPVTNLGRVVWEAVSFDEG